MSSEYYGFRKDSKCSLVKRVGKVIMLRLTLHIKVKMFASILSFYLVKLIQHVQWICLLQEYILSILKAILRAISRLLAIPASIF
jgi:hypothetical protein